MGRTPETATGISGTREPRLRRSLLFVPADDPRKLERSPGAGADTLIFDLEDAVAPERKEKARTNLISVVRGRDFGNTETAVRVNAPETPYFEEDLQAVLQAGAAAVMLPKCETAAGVESLATVADAHAARREAVGAPLRILALVESAAGILHAHAIGRAAPRVDALCFGHVDFALDLGVADIRSSADAIHHARCALVLAAKAARVAPIDHVCLSVGDDAEMRREAVAGLHLGYEGKLCIHPQQVTIANEVYTPTEEQIAHALRVVAAAQEASAAGRGVFRLDGKMVDAPVVGAQQKVLARARKAGLLSDR